MTIIAFDPGYGAIKIFGPYGNTVFQSAVATDRATPVQRMTGLRASRPPLQVQTDAGGFYIGEGAHDWGRPVENLDFDRLTGAPEMHALFLGGISKYAASAAQHSTDGKYGITSQGERIDLIVGLPILALTGDQAAASQQGVRRFLKGHHCWKADGVAQEVIVESVQITSQPVGALFDFLLTDDGEMPPQKKKAFKGEIGILGVGMNTVDLLVVRDGTPIQRFTAGETIGVRRLLELINGDGLYSLGELDTQLRNRGLDLSQAQPVWQREVMGLVERLWGDSYRRFTTVIVVGGGALLLQKSLVTRFDGKAFIPEDPVIATARGLYKYAQMRIRRGR